MARVVMLLLALCLTSAASQACKDGDMACEMASDGSITSLLQHEAGKLNKTKKGVKTAENFGPPAPPTPPAPAGSCAAGTGKDAGTTPFCTNPSFSLDTNCPFGQTCDADLGGKGCCCSRINPFEKCGASSPSPAPAPAPAPSPSGTCPAGTGKDAGTTSFCTNPSLSLDTNCPLFQTCDADLGGTGCCCSRINPFDKCT